MRRSNLTVVIWLILVFASGVLVGVFGQRLYSARTVLASRERGGPRLSPEEFRKRYMEDLRQRLQLSSDQFKRIDTILDETKQRFDAVNERFHPEMRAIREEQQNRIRGILNETQRTEYNKMLDEREKRRREGGPPPRP